MVAAKNFKHGFAKRRQASEYNAFLNARHRCTDPTNKRWKDYGGRGIEFRFENPEQWMTELGRRPSLQHSVDRINNDGHYEPGNVRWATAEEQQANTRKVL